MSDKNHLWVPLESKTKPFYEYNMNTLDTQRMRDTRATYGQQSRIDNHNPSWRDKPSSHFAQISASLFPTITSEHLQKLQTPSESSGEPWDWSVPLNKSARSPMCWTTQDYATCKKTKNKKGHIPNVMVIVENFMTGEAASPTKYLKVYDVKHKTKNYGHQSNDPTGENKGMFAWPQMVLGYVCGRKKTCIKYSSTN